MYFVLVALSAKNTPKALVVLTWGNAMASLGTIIGANLGRLLSLIHIVEIGFSIKHRASRTKT